MNHLTFILTMKRIILVFALTGLSGAILNAQTTPCEMQQITVNSRVTTLITASEPILLADISTDDVVGDRPLDNVLRLKPASDEHSDGELLSVITIITERYRTQYSLIYTTRMDEAVTDKEIEPYERFSYNNPDVSMSTAEMARFARQVWCSPARFRGTGTRMHRMEMRLNNIYAAGDYFFIDFSVENHTGVKFDIDQLRVKLADRKVTKAANAQTVELTPRMILEKTASFRKGYRNVIVIDKLTFPNDKVLTVELSEKQISGRTIRLDIDYEDVLSADTFSESLLIEQ